MASSKFSYQKLFTLFIFLFSIFLMFLLLSSTPPLNIHDHHQIDTDLSPLVDNLNWFNLIFKKPKSMKKIKIGLVNVINTNHIFQGIRKYNEMVEIVNVAFNGVDDNKKWEDFFPEWIDEDSKWSPPRCPEIPMPPKMEEDYKDLDIIVANVPCGIRNVYRLQVNLVVANLAVVSGRDGDHNRTVYVVFIGSCGPMHEIFRVDDLLKNSGDFWVYKPELWRLEHKLLMPVGSCLIAPPLGKEVRTSLRSKARPLDLKLTTSYQREAYVTVLHSSEVYVCGAIALAQSIIRSKSKRNLILLHDKSITGKSLRGLRAAGWKTRLIERIRSPFAKKDSYNEFNYSKLRIWQLTKYDRVIFIDADIIVLKNIDKLFSYVQLSAAPNNKFLFNSGIMLIEPSLSMFDYLMSKIDQLKSYNGGDQGFLNEVFTWWHRWPTKMNHLKVYKKSSNKKGKHELPSDVHTLHYLGLKPWMCYRDYDCNWDIKQKQIFASDDAHTKWWQLYDSMPKGLKQFCALSKQGNSRIHKYRNIAKNDGLSNGHWRINVVDPRQYPYLQV